MDPVYASSPPFHQQSQNCNRDEGSKERLFGGDGLNSIDFLAAGNDSARKIIVIRVFVPFDISVRSQRCRNRFINSNTHIHARSQEEETHERGRVISRKPLNASGCKPMSYSLLCAVLDIYLCDFAPPNAVAGNAEIYQNVCRKDKKKEND
jgi:hypothetical protein